MHYTPNFRKSFHTFEEILENADKWHKTLSEMLNREVSIV